MEHSITKCRYKGCGESALALAEFCWEHISDKGQYKECLLAAIREGGTLSGSCLKRVVLRDEHIEKANLSGVDLSLADLSGTYLFDSCLERAELIGINLSHCDLAHCSMRGADLTKANLANARLWNSDLTGANLTEADLSHADLWDARLHNATLWHTNFSGTKSLGKVNFCSSRKLFEKARIDESGAVSAEESYRNLKQYFISTGRYSDASWASFKEKTMERILLRKNGHFEYIPSLVMSLLCGYGEKPYRIVLTALLTILAFAFIYYGLDSVQYLPAPGHSMKWGDYIYYSTITFTTVGYGDIVPKPNTVFRLIAASEAFMGVFVTGLFVFTLARKYSAR